MNVKLPNIECRSQNHMLFAADLACNAAECHLQKFDSNCVRPTKHTTVDTGFSLLQNLNRAYKYK
jgi:hypothetical protein